MWEANHRFTCRCWSVSPRVCAKRYGGVYTYCDTVAVCLNETAIELGSRRTESASSVTANAFKHLRRRYRNVYRRTCLRERPHRACSKRAGSCEPGTDADPWAVTDGISSKHVRKVGHGVGSRGGSLGTI